MFEIEGLDKLQRQLKQAGRTFAELDGELAKVSVDPADPSSVQRAVAEIRARIDRKAAPFRGNPFVEPIVRDLKLHFERAIRDRAAGLGRANSAS